MFAKGLGKVAGAAEPGFKGGIGDTQPVFRKQYSGIGQAFLSKILKYGASKHLFKSPGQAGVAHACLPGQISEGRREFQPGDQDIPGRTNPVPLIRPDRRARQGSVKCLFQGIGHKLHGLALQEDLPDQSLVGAGIHLVKHGLHGEIHGLGIKKMALANGLCKGLLGTGFMGRAQKAGNFFRREPDHHGPDFHFPGSPSLQERVFKIVEMDLSGCYSKRGRTAGVQGLGGSGQTEHKGEPGCGPGDSGQVIPGKTAAAHADIHARPAVQVQELALAQSGRYRPHALPARAGKRLFSRKPDKSAFRIFYGHLSTHCLD